MKNNLLEIGDELYVDNSLLICTVTRVTLNHAILHNGMRVYRECLHYTTIVGSRAWNKTIYKLITPENREDILKKISRQKINCKIYSWGCMNLSESIRRLTDSQAERIVEILLDKKP
jgi:hypothetical protein